MMTHAEWEKNSFETEISPKWFISSAYPTKVQMHFKYLVFYSFLDIFHLRGHSTIGASPLLDIRSKKDLKKIKSIWRVISSLR